MHITPETTIKNNTLIIPYHGLIGSSTECDQINAEREQTPDAEAVLRWVTGLPLSAGVTPMAKECLENKLKVME